MWTKLVSSFGNFIYYDFLEEKYKKDISILKNSLILNRTKYLDY